MAPAPTPTLKNNICPASTPAKARNGSGSDLMKLLLEGEGGGVLDCQVARRKEVDELELSQNRSRK